MTRDELLAAILADRVIGIVRLDRSEGVVEVVRAIVAGGVRCVEVSLTTPGAREAISDLASHLPDALIGAGTVTTAAELDACVEAGARFIVTPVTLPDLVSRAHHHGVPIAMGAFSPTEIHLAHRAGADLIKLFPASAFDPSYLKAVRAPFPELRLVPTGGVDSGNARAWLNAGAAALGVGGGLTDPAAIAAGRYDRLTEHARELMASLS